METYWDSFIERYKNQIPTKPLSLILEAFYSFCKEHRLDKETADNLMDYKE